jgi:hypothetical protein
LIAVDGLQSEAFNSIEHVIYCVVPRAFADELFEALTSHYSEEPHVTVIVDRRGSSRRRRNSSAGGKRFVRDRRRPRVTGELLELASG